MLECKEDLVLVGCKAQHSTVLEMAIWSTGGPFPNLPHHLDLASEGTVGHSIRMSVLARRRAIMGSIGQPKRSCLRAVTAGGVQRNPHTDRANIYMKDNMQNKMIFSPLPGADQKV